MDHQILLCQEAVAAVLDLNFGSWCQRNDQRVRGASLFKKQHRTTFQNQISCLVVHQKWKLSHSQLSIYGHLNISLLVECPVSDPSPPPYLEFSVIYILQLLLVLLLASPSEMPTGLHHGLVCFQPALTAKFM